LILDSIREETRLTKTLNGRPLDGRQNHMVDIVMKKTADNGYACERKFAEDWFTRSGQKLVQTVGAIAADIEKRMSPFLPSVFPLPFISSIFCETRSTVR